MCKYNLWSTNLKVPSVFRDSLQYTSLPSYANCPFQITCHSLEKYSFVQIFAHERINFQEYHHMVWNGYNKQRRSRGLIISIVAQSFLSRRNEERRSVGFLGIKKKYFSQNLWLWWFLSSRKDLASLAAVLSLVTQCIPTNVCLLEPNIPFPKLTNQHEPTKNEKVYADWSIFRG